MIFGARVALTNFGSDHGFRKDVFATEKDYELETKNKRYGCRFLYFPFDLLLEA